MEIMLDLETYSTEPNASILVIGAIKFNRKDKITDLDNYDTFYRRIIPSSCVNIGLHVDPKTVEWWKHQSQDAINEAIQNTDRIPIHQALHEFTEWFNRVIPGSRTTSGNTKIWGHGDDFDCVVLGSAYRACGKEPPWKFWNTRDTRTLFDLANISMKDLPQDNAHHALHDAYRQIIGVRKSLDILRIK